MMKFRDNASRRLEPDSVDELGARILSMESTDDVRSLMAMATA